jgi:GT2 family glycosyltransferase
VEASLAYASLAGKITVVDNNSRDGTDALMTEKFHSVNYIRHKENYGTAKGFNRGIRESGNALYTFLMNDDVELFPSTLHDMLETLSKYPEARGIPANLMYADGSPQRIKLDVVGLSRRTSDSVRRASFPGTTACLYHTEVFHHVGLFDEFYFFYNEDLDFALRAKRMDLVFMFDPRIKVVHHGYMGRSKGERFVKPHAFSADYYFYRKHYGLFAATLFLCTIMVRLTLKRWNYKKRKNTKQLELLESGASNLKNTVKNYKKIIKTGNL